MTVKYKLDKLMKEAGMSLNQLAKITGLSQTTIRDIKNLPDKNVEVKTLKKISIALNCSIRDLIDDDSWNYYYQTLSEGRKKALLTFDQLFSSDNIDFFQESLSKIGIISDITRTGFLKALSIVSQPDKSPVVLNIYLRINQTNTINLEIINFDVYVNQEVLSEQFIKRSLVDVIELYAIKNNMDSITFFNMGNKTQDSYEYPLEEPSTTFHSDPNIDKKILRIYNYKPHDVPYPLLKENTWTKYLKQKKSPAELNT